MKPTLTVILPVYNSEDFLKKTIDSILGQTFADFELLIINDASTDSSQKIISSYEDLRIKCFENQENLKLIKTLNRGISLAKGMFIARIDADDICLPTRFAKQIEFLEKNPEIAVVGTDIYFIDYTGKRTGRGIIQGTSASELRWEIHRRCCLYHPSVMINHSLVGADFFYDENYPNSEDHELWLRLSKKYRLANLPEPLLEYRVHGASITQTSSETTVRSMLLALKTHSHLLEENVKKRDEYSELLRFPFRIKSKEQFREMLIVFTKTLLRHLDLAENEREKRALSMNAASYVFILSFAYVKKFKLMPLVNMIHFIRATGITALEFLMIIRIYLTNIYRRILYQYLG